MDVDADPKFGQGATRFGRGAASPKCRGRHFPRNWGVLPNGQIKRVLGEGVGAWAPSPKFQYPPNFAFVVVVVGGRVGQP